MRRTRISILCAALLATLPASAEAGGLGSVVGAVASGPARVLGGLFGGGRARHHRQHTRRPATEHARHTPSERAVARVAPAATVPAGAAAAAATATPAPVQGNPTDRPPASKPAYRGSPTFGPAAYTDAFAYVLTPARYDGAFWGRGYGDVVDAMFVANAADPAGKKSRRGRSAEPANAADSAATPGCAEADNAGALREQIERIVEPSEAQRPALDELGNALRLAAERVRTACRAEITGGPGARLDAMWRHLRALRQAVILVRAPLRNFYDTLSEAQKARLDSLAQEGAGVASAQNSRPDAWLRACESARMPEWPMASIMRTVQLTEDQRAMVELLMGVSLHFAHQLRASCAATPAPLTATDRLEAADQRLTAMVYAVTVLRGMLNQFYGALSDDQRARFDAMNPRPEPRRAELH
jgi:hypothetical protein